MTKFGCTNCNGGVIITITAKGKEAVRPCPCCSDSGTPDLDYTLGMRYSAGIDNNGKLVRPLMECLNRDGSVKAERV